MAKNSYASILAFVLLFTACFSHASEETAAPQSKRESEKQATSHQLNPFQEVSDLKTKIIEIQNKSRLGFSKVVACSSIDAFGVYSPLEPSSPTGKIVFYVEPANYSTLQSADRYIVDCAVDIQILDGSGRPVVSSENVSKINRISRSPIMDLYFKIELNLKMARRPENIQVRIVLHDKIKNQSSSANIKVKLEAGKSKQEEQI